MYQQIVNFVLPEVFVASMACFILMVDAFSNSKKGTCLVYTLSLLTLVGAAYITFLSMPSHLSMGFVSSIILDRTGSVLKILMLIILIVIFMYSREYMKDRGLFKGEFFVLCLFSVLGMMILVSGSSYLTLFLGLELFVLPLYALIVMSDQRARYTEAAMKYFIIGSLGAGLLLYGISLMYGATGSLSLASTSSVFPVLLQVGMVFVIVGIAIEFGAVPFHMWLPDVYEGSPTAVTMIIATLPKIAIFGMTYRLLTISFPTLSEFWQTFFIFLGVMSIGFGNIVAIVQKNIKRMLAYSTIGHIGFIFLALFVGPENGYSVAMFYTLVYVLMSLAAFGMVLRLSGPGFEAEYIDDFKGLNKRNPWLAFLMMLIMLSLAGIPPLVGFYAKFTILQALVQQGYVWLAILALIFSVIGAYYYLNIVKVMYFDQTDDAIEPIQVDNNSMGPVGRALLGINSMLLLVLGIYPGPLLFMCITAMK